MITAIVGIAAFGVGYGVCKFFGPQVNVEAGIVWHKGVTYVKKELAYAQSKL